MEEESPAPLSAGDLASGEEACIPVFLGLLSGVV